MTNNIVFQVSHVAKATKFLQTRLQERPNMREIPKPGIRFQQKFWNRLKAKGLWAPPRQSLVKYSTPSPRSQTSPFELKIYQKFVLDFHYRPSIVLISTWFWVTCEHSVETQASWQEFRLLSVENSKFSLFQCFFYLSA